MPPRRLKPGTFAPEDFMLAIGMGRIPGYQATFIVGISASSPLGTETLIWDIVGLRTPIAVPAEIYISSTNVGDVAGPTVFITALDENGDETWLNATLNGQGQVQAVNIYGGSNLVSWIQSAVCQTSTPLGDVYIALTDTLTLGIPDTASAIQGKIVQGNNTTRIGSYKVPNNKAATFTAIRASTDDNTKLATIISEVIPVGQPMIRANEYVVAADFPGIDVILPFGTFPFNTPDGNTTLSFFPGGTVIDYIAVPASNNTVVTVGFDLIVVEKEFIGNGL